MVGISIGTILILIRCVYRVIELAQGWSGYLITHEPYFMSVSSTHLIQLQREVLISTLVSLAIASWTPSQCCSVSLASSLRILTLPYRLLEKRSSFLIPNPPLLHQSLRSQRHSRSPFELDEIGSVYNMYSFQQFSVCKSLRNLDRDALVLH
jgi:hypothetical protein